MKWTQCLMLISSVVLVSGCVTPEEEEKPVPTNDYCVVVNPLFFDSDAVVDWLAENDPALLRGVVGHNEQMERLCS